VPAATTVAPLAPKTSSPAEEKEAAKEAATKISGGDFFGAMQVWTRLINSGTDKQQGYLQRAKLKRQIGDSRGAQDDLDMALKLNPRNFLCLMERALIKRKAGDLHGAMDDLDKAIEAQPGKAEAFVERGSLKLALNNYNGSYGDYHQAVKLDPSLKAKLGALALAPRKPGEKSSENAGEQSDQKVGEKPGERTVERTVEKTGEKTIERTGEKTIDKPVEKAVIASGATDSAALAANNVATSQGQLARLNNAAVKQIVEGQFEQAIKTLNELTSIAPNYANARENLTIAHNNWGLELAKRTPAEAAKQFRQALYLDLNQGASRRNLDAVIKELGKNPRDAETRLTLAQESLAAGDDIGAFVEAYEALKLKNNASARAMLKATLLRLDKDK